MAGAKLNTSAKIDASTIIEVIISMIVIVLVFGIAMMIFNNVMRVSLSVKKVRAQAVLQQIMLTAEQAKNNSTQTLTLDDFTIDEKVETYPSGSLSIITLTAYDENKLKIIILQKIINNND